MAPRHAAIIMGYEDVVGAQQDPYHRAHAGQKTTDHNDTYIQHKHRRSRPSLTNPKTYYFLHLSDHHTITQLSTLYNEVQKKQEHTNIMATLAQDAHLQPSDHLARIVPTFTYYEDIRQHTRTKNCHSVLLLGATDAR